MSKILIVGGVAGGAGAAARIRRLDEKADIIMFEKGEHISYANCGLPYYIGGEIKEKSALFLQTPESFKKRFNVDARVLNEVISIDKENKKVKVRNLKTGEIYEENYDKLILSCGARPIKPKIEGIDLEQVFTLRTVSDAYKIKDYAQQNRPKSAAVMGAGFIGVEIAENLQSLGADVNLIEASNQALSLLDYELACEIHQHIQKKGVKLFLNNAVKKISKEGNSLKISLDGKEITADMLVVSIGVSPESELAKNAGLSLSKRGAIIVDEYMRTSDENIYAVGDSVETVDFVSKEKITAALAGPANKQARIAADNICGAKSKYSGTQSSAIVKIFDMTAASTGINEKTAKKLGLNYDKSFTYSASHAGYYPGALNMSVKIIFEKNTGRLLGAQIAGFDGVDKRCDVLASAIRANMSVFDLTKLDLCYAPPYSSAKDPVNTAGCVAENILTGKMKHFHWHDVESLPRDGSITLLDTRTSAEYENGHIDGFINTPLDLLRERLNELDKSKPVYLTCQIGLRGYIAARILMQNGFDAYNLNGGYRLYRLIFGKTDGALQNDSSPKNFDKPVENGGCKIIRVDACGLQCPGPIVKLGQTLKEASDGDIIEIKTTDPAFASDIQNYCNSTGNQFLELTSQKGVDAVKIKKTQKSLGICNAKTCNSKNFIVFSEDLDRAIAAFIMANAAAAMDRKVKMFFTFWGLNILKRSERVCAKKDFISKMFGFMTPRGSLKLPLSKMNVFGLGAKLIRFIMKRKNAESLETLIEAAKKLGVEFIACSMSMDIMGIKREELIDGVQIGGAASMLSFAEQSDMSLFI
ncbi:MAG: FAD-dependent oxidoreductase [Endomicrobium sp.]|jgi:NADPH-dependent 2,4-dienoyl-CoA reductase/sulfur reductase-like enzyme/peroxiredoxin family protein/rhodanese-related sulfurtransferase/TusA-related sulfurtransferase|nr:FAD-dependent oxidoreductase [Endomicrobium sp.]